MLALYNGLYPAVAGRKIQARRWPSAQVGMRLKWAGGRVARRLRPRSHLRVRC